VQEGHLDDKCKEIVDEGVEGFVDEDAPWKMGY
jgi:hypothetical protein